MKVITLDEQRFRESCARLRDKVYDAGFNPDVIVGIARGGVYVAEHFGKENTYSIVCQRSGTSSRKSLVPAILKALPTWLNSFMRCAESVVLEWVGKFRKTETGEVPVDQELAKVLKWGALRVLVVDDAVDSGKTLRNVLHALREISPSNDVRSAAITVTRKYPLIMPDYYIYHDRTLIRFPWSDDVK